MLVSVIALVVPLVFLGEAGDALRQEDRERLADCIHKIDVQPAEAYEDGLAWQGEGNRPEARQCTALALIALGREEEGASRLEALATSSDGGTIASRATYFAQAGNAWLISGRPGAALTAFDEAVKLGAGDPDIFKDRARAYLLEDMWPEAERDLTKALSARANDAQGYRLRSEARLQQSDLDGAYEDIRIAMELAPDDVEVMVQRGRVREARRLAEEL